MGKHVVITGGGSGIGAAIADELNRSGHSLTLMGRDLEKIEKKAISLNHAQAVSVDVSQKSSVELGFEVAFKQFGEADILINSAGIATTIPFSKIDQAHWNLMLNVNLTGVYNCVSICLPLMKERGWGRIINIASTAGLKGYEYCVAYCASKHGVIGLTKALALEVARSGVTVNAVCPGFTETDIVKKGLQNIVDKTGRSYEEAKKSMVALNPQKRFIQPKEVVAAVNWLIHEDSGSITGQSISVSGGEVMV